MSLFGATFRTQCRDTLGVAGFFDVSLPCKGAAMQEGEAEVGKEGATSLSACVEESPRAAFALCPSEESGKRSAGQ